MKKKDLRHLGRRDLLRLLLEVQRENETLRAENETLHAEIEDRRIAVSQLGSIADACMQLNHVFEAAQAAADQYVENARVMYAPETDESTEQDPGEDGNGEEE